jgi:hypothetical protein
VQGWVSVWEVSTQPQSIEVSGERLVKTAHPRVPLNGTPSFISKKNFCIFVPKSIQLLEDHERDATIVKGLPRLRAFARIDVTERFSETAMLAGDEPSSISAIKCAVWAGVHFLLPMRTIRPNPARQPSFRNEMGYGRASLESSQKFAATRS